jgi:uncharacterized membrane protein YkgB
MFHYTIERGAKIDPQATANQSLTGSPLPVTVQVGSEWTFGTLLFLGFWNKKLGILGALGSSVTFACTASIIPFMPDGWAASAGGFPAMTEHVAFLMKDIVLFAVSVYLLRQDLIRVLRAAEQNDDTAAWAPSR